jgi:hypothetical protein
MAPKTSKPRHEMKPIFLYVRRIYQLGYRLTSSTSERSNDTYQRSNIERLFESIKLDDALFPTRGRITHLPGLSAAGVLNSGHERTVVISSLTSAVVVLGLVHSAPLSSQSP